LATVLSHDVEFLLAGLAAAETVGGVGARVFVQSARRRHGCGHSERRRRPRRHAHAVCGVRRLLPDVRAELTIDEIAQSLSLSREAVKGRLHRARGLIREYLTG
jgi:hypothetical protein